MNRIHLLALGSIIIIAVCWVVWRNAARPQLAPRPAEFANRHHEMGQDFSGSAGNTSKIRSSEIKTLPLLNFKDFNGAQCRLQQSIVSRTALFCVSKFKGAAASSDQEMPEWGRKWPVLIYQAAIFSDARNADTNQIISTCDWGSLNILDNDVLKALNASHQLKPYEVEVIAYQHLLEVERKIVPYEQMGATCTELFDHEESRLKKLRETAQAPVPASGPELDLSFDLEESTAKAKSAQRFLLLVTGARDNLGDGDSLEAAVRRWFSKNSAIAQWIYENASVVVCEITEPLKDSNREIIPSALRTRLAFGDKYLVPYGIAVYSPQIVLLNPNWTQFQTAPIDLSDTASFLRILEILDERLPQKPKQ